MTVNEGVVTPLNYSVYFPKARRVEPRELALVPCILCRRWDFFMLLSLNTKREPLVLRGCG